MSKVLKILKEMDDFPISKEVDDWFRKGILRDNRTVEEKNTSTYSNLAGCYVNTKTGEKLHDDGKILDSNGWRKND